MANRQWPYAAASSVGASSGNAETLLNAILAAGRLDEISNAEDAIEEYIRATGHVDGAGRLQTGVIFWVYPTGAKGPYEETDSGEILKHGSLLTIERGAWLEDAVHRAELAVLATGIAHEHVAARI
jgi:hypothetical protein